MAIENRKKAREKSGKHLKEKDAGYQAPVGGEAKAARAGGEWSPGLCMARREFLLYSRARRFASAVSRGV